MMNKAVTKVLNKDILLVMALKSECQGKFTQENVIYTGVGKVNAAYELTKSITRYKPKIVINLGSVGSSTFKRGMVVSCTNFIQRDMDVQPLGFEKWVTPFEEGSDEILNYGVKISGLEEATCGTGDNFDISQGEEAYNVVDMEGYALAKICQKEDISFICLKYVTDGAGSDAPKEWSESLKDAAEGLYDEYLKLYKRK